MSTHIFHTTTGEQRESFYVEIDSSCHLIYSFSSAGGYLVVFFCFPIFLFWLATWLIISLSCFTYRHTSAGLGLSRTEARLNGFGNCLLIHLNRIHKSLPSLCLGRNPAPALDVLFFLSFIWSEGPLWVDNWLTALMGRAEQISQLNEAMEEKGLSLCSSLSLYSVALKKPLREIKWPDCRGKWRRQMQRADMLQQTLCNATNWKKGTLMDNSSQPPPEERTAVNSGSAPWYSAVFIWQL